MTAKRRCLGCGNTYPLEDHACPKCGSHAAEVEVKSAKPADFTKPKPRRKP